MTARDFRERQADREADAAAAEAAAIGGRVETDGQDPAYRAVSEGGGGESEGFEIAEEELREHASHGDSGPDPTHMAGAPELETDRSTAAYGEADEEHTSERSDDPEDQATEARADDA